MRKFTMKQSKLMFHTTVYSKNPRGVKHFWGSVFRMLEYQNQSFL
jgi:hypothetical protein